MQGFAFRFGGLSASRLAPEVFNVDCEPTAAGGGSAWRTLEGICNAPGSGRWIDALSAPQPEDESLIDTSSPYSQSEKRAETEHRYESVGMSGVLNEVQQPQCTLTDE
jgi:hypothetical protein